jgi:NCAIR mutase (PurE)-related protein
MNRSSEGVGVVIDFSNERGGHGRHDEGSAGVVHPHPRQAVNAVRTLRRSVGRIDLSDPEMAEAFQVLAEIEVELRACEPNRAAVASRLERLVELLSAGSADLPVVRSTRAIATWVGPMGAPLVERLG